MPQAQRPRAEVLVLRTWIEGHRSPLRVRILQLIEGEQFTSTVVDREEDALVIVAEWLHGWSTYGHDQAELQADDGVDR